MRMEQSKIWWPIGEEETKQNRWYTAAEVTEVFFSMFRLIMQKFFLRSLWWNLCFDTLVTKITRSGQPFTSYCKFIKQKMAVSLCCVHAARLRKRRQHRLHTIFAPVLNLPVHVKFNFFWFVWALTTMKKMQVTPSSYCELESTIYFRFC